MIPQFRRRKSGVWAPASMQGLYCALDRSGITADGSNRVSSWRCSITGNAFTQAATGNMPLLQAGTSPMGNSAIYPDGVDDSLQSLTSFFAGTDIAFTVAYTYKIDGTGKNWRCPWSMGGSSTNRLSGQSNSVAPRFIRATDAAASSILTFPTLNYSVWYNVIQVCDGTNVTTYINGVPQGTQPLTASGALTPNRATIGAQVYYSGGVVDNVISGWMCSFLLAKSAATPDMIPAINQWLTNTW